MKFCPECDSMLYHIESNGELIEKCKECDYSSPCYDRIIETNVYKNTTLQSADSKRYIRYDPALPRTIHKECPNEDCPSRNNKLLQEAVFYPDRLTMKLIYICVICNTEWKYS
jgi:DNA-directed RNA polymerase subunit M/transcription elongation factor TFIIS